MPFGITTDLLFISSLCFSGINLFIVYFLYGSDINIIFSAFFNIFTPIALKCIILSKNTFTSVFLTATIYGILYS